MMRLSIDGLSIIDFHNHQRGQSLGSVSPTSLCGGGELRNRNAPFKVISQFNDKREKKKATPLLL